MFKHRILAVSFVAAALFSVQPAVGYESSASSAESGEVGGFSLELRKAIANAEGISLSEVDGFVDKQRERIDLADDLQANFPSKYSGIWMGSDGETHVSATDESVLSYAKSKMPGIKPHLVKYSQKNLQDIKEEVEKRLESFNPGDGSYVAIDAENNKVSVAYAPKEGEVTQYSTPVSLSSLTEEQGDVIEWKTPDPEIKFAGCENGWDCFPHLRAGMFIKVGSKYCTSGFTARNRKGEKYILTAGHCGGNGSSVWTGRRERTPVGVLTNSSNNASTDSARIYVSDPAWKLTRWVRMDSGRQAMSIIGKLPQGSAANTTICKSGMATGLTCGRILKADYDIVVGGVWHKGFWQANFRSSGGDSGGPVFVPYNAKKNASKAYGLVSGYQGNASTVGPGIYNVEHAQNVSIVTN